MRSRDNLLCQWFDQLWTKGDVHAIDRLGGPTLRAHGADGVTRSIDEFRAWHGMLRAAIPDIEVRIEHTVDNGSSIAAHWVATGTHSGDTPALGPASHRRIEIHGLSIARVEGGRLVEGWDDFDFADLMTQMGVAAV